MAFDGFVVSELVYELGEKLVGGRINKISQPEKDEILLTIKNYDTYKLDISVSASLPLVRLVDENKPAPLTAPAFCMLLRKHLTSARILSIDQPEMERVIRLHFEHLDEMGDVRQKWLMVELMGKHSNIIFTDEEFNVIDAIKRVPASVSSVREVLPGRDYFIPKTTGKCDVRSLEIAGFSEALKAKSFEVQKALYSAFTGFSPLISTEICMLSGIDASKNTSELSDKDIDSLFEICRHFTELAAKGEYSPTIVFKDEAAVEYSCFSLRSYPSPEYRFETFSDMSSLLGSFYSIKEKQSRIAQKSQALRKSLGNAIERAAKKLDLQETQLRSTEKRDKYKVYGELITSYGYGVPEGSKEMNCINFYDGKEITIPLDDTIPVMANAKRYFDRYAKLKRTYEAVTEQLAATKEELYHLQSIQNSMDMADNESDLAQIRRELEEFGYAKRSGASFRAGSKGNAKSGYNGKNSSSGKASGYNSSGKNNSNTGYGKGNSGNGKGSKGSSGKSLPLHYRTPEGYDIYVGKNNYQNDELSFKFANGSDWWFHSKTIPGSHVILKNKGEEIPDRVFEYAASCAAYYSSDKTGGKVEIDYLERKNLKKPNGAKPGFVVYYTNYSMVAEATLKGLIEIND